MSSAYEPPQPSDPQPSEPQSSGPQPSDAQPSGPPGYGQQPGYGPPSGSAQGYPGPQGYGRAPMQPQDEKLWAVGAHLGPVLLGFVAPLVVWLVGRERSAFLDRTGKEALNMQLSYLLYFLVAGVSMVVLVGFLLLPVIGVAWFVLMVIATIKVSSYEDYRYPAIIRFIK